MTDLTILFNLHFGLALRETQIRAAVHNRGLCTGRDTRFKPGVIPPNKGKKGYCPAGCEKGWFGTRPVWNERPVGSERVNTQGYVEVKVSDKHCTTPRERQRRWKTKHCAIWEKANGKVPGGHVVIFADGNKRNFALDNLLLVSRSELSVMNSCGLISAHKDLTMSGKLIADIKMLLTDRKQQTQKTTRRKKA